MKMMSLLLALYLAGTSLQAADAPKAHRAPKQYAPKSKRVNCDYVWREHHWSPVFSDGKKFCRICAVLVDHVPTETRK